MKISGNHKVKTSKTYTNDKEKRIKAYQYRKIIKLQRKGSREEQRNYKTNRKALT